MQHSIISGFCKATSPNHFVEAGCAVCGTLTLCSELQRLADLDLDLSPLIREGVNQVERNSPDDPNMNIEGPVIDEDLDSICNTCYKSVLKGKTPLMALANGKWLGKVPLVLQNLSFAEQLLVARVRYNRCIVKVSSGMHKMRANAISFANPVRIGGRGRVYKSKHLTPLSQLSVLEQLDESVYSHCCDRGISSVGL